MSRCFSVHAILGIRTLPELSLRVDGLPGSHGPGDYANRRRWRKRYDSGGPVGWSGCRLSS